MCRKGFVKMKPIYIFILKNLWWMRNKNENVWDMQFLLPSNEKYARSMLNGVSWNSEAKWPNDFEGQSQWLPFSIPVGSMPGWKFRANLAIVAQICEELLHWNTEFVRILSQNNKNDLAGHCQWPSLLIQKLRIYQDACFVQISFSSWNLWWVIVNNKVKFTDRMANRQTDRYRQWQWLFERPKM